MRIRRRALIVLVGLAALVGTVAWTYNAQVGKQTATVLVTGSNRGIGLEFVRQYATAGWSVIATARNPDRASALKDLAEEHSNISIKQLDIIDDASVKALAQDLMGQPIDVLINNAGVLGDPSKQTLGGFSYDEFLKVMGVNAYGALAVSEALRDNVIASDQKKIIAISSGSGIISGSGPESNLYFYSASKIALNMVMKGLAADLKPAGVIVGILAPGSVNTDLRHELVGERAAEDQLPQDSVVKMIKVIKRLTQANSQKPLLYNGKEMPW